MKCFSCGQDEVEAVTTDCSDPDNPGETLVFGVCKNCDYGINDHTEGECKCRRVNDLSAYPIDVLLRAAFSLTHQMHGQHRIDTTDERAKRDLIVAEIKWRCGDE